MSQADAPSPPSLPPPTQSAPGPRASRLQSLLDSAVSHTVSTLTYRNFAACFPTPQAYSPAALETLHRDFTNLLDERCKAELAAVLEQRDVVRLLNELDELLQAAKKRKEAHDDDNNAAGSGSHRGRQPEAAQQHHHHHQPSALPPDVILQAHLRPFLAEQSQAMARRVQDTQEKNVMLADSIRQQRAEVEALVGGLEGLVADLERAGAAARQSAELVKGEVQEAATGEGERKG